jgi:hypothetical protein
MKQKNNDNERHRKFYQMDTTGVVPETTPCCFCGKEVHEFFLTIEGREMCDDCYGEALQFLVE